MIKLRSLTRIVIAAGASLAGVAGVAFVAAPAGATVIHQKEGGFNGSDAPGGPFGPLVISDAVDQSSGDVWVMESNAFGFGQGVVDRFDGHGAYGLTGVQITGAQTPQKSFALGFDSSGTAVDNSAGARKGDVYIADTEHGVVDRFSETGTFQCQITAKVPVSAEEIEHECNGASGSATPDGSITPAGVAVDSSGDVYVADIAHAVIDKFDSAGGYVSQITDAHLTHEMRTMAVGPEGSVYVQVEGEGHPASVLKYSAGGAFVSVFDSKEAQSVGVDPVTGHVYVDEVASEQLQIAEFEASGALVSITPTPEAVYAGLAIAGSTGSIYATQFFGGTIAIFGGDIVVPTATTGLATNITETAATLNGTVDPDGGHGGGEVTGCQFEYGTTTSYGAIAPCAPEPPYTGASAVSADVASLKQATEYHFRIEAHNANGISSPGKDATFTTAGPPVVESASAHVNGTQVHLRAHIDSSGLDTTCEAQYVDDTAFTHTGYASAVTLPCTPEDLGSKFGGHLATVTVNGLKVATTYHYRFLASNRLGVSGAAGQTFTTFGANSFKFEIVNKEGEPFTQAAGHPYELSTSFKINEFLRSPDEPGLSGSTKGADGNVKDVVSQLPAGLIGDPSAMGKCTRARVLARECPGTDQVGVIGVDLEGEENSKRLPVYNVVPPKGIAVEFASTPLGKANLLIDSKLRSGGDYGVTAESANITALAAVRNVTLKLWGVPADASHDKERTCGQQEECVLKEDERVLKPFLRTPTSCTGPLASTLSLDSWQNPGEYMEATSQMPAMTGCGEVQFTPAVGVQPTTSRADSPTGLRVVLHLPQNQDPEHLAEGDLRNTTVTLPPGLTANPSAANGLGTCSPGQIGLTSGPGASPITFTPAPAECPKASERGTVEVDTPLLDHPLEGDLYLATPYRNPFNSLLAIYIAVDDPQTGVVVKLAGNVELNPESGQITATFTDSPQVPFEDFKLDFFEGERADLATPEGCGGYTTSASLSSWSGTPAVSPAVEGFSISSGCVSGFAPTFTVGSASVQAGAYAPVTLSFSRADTDQEFAGLSASLPPGLLAQVAGVPLCSDAALAAAAAKSGAAEAAQPSCPEGSQVATVRVTAGAGGDPFLVSGKAYLTGAYKGGPYGLAVVVPAVAGPFDLGTVVVRSSLHIDPTDAHVTAISDPFPTILKGIPLRMRRVTLAVDRPGFTFNPTNCAPLSAAATLLSTGGLSAAVPQRFQVGGCQNLPFKPRFTVSTGATSSKANGVSLDVRVSTRPGEANIGKVAVSLPRALPSRLTTIQQACTEAQFAANPAKCPTGSLVGSAVARTPVLASPLTGPAYLVSHGGRAFPDLVLILQGEGVEIVLTGHIDIKKGITSSHFEALPDAPISSFELTLPTGRHSALTAYLPAKAHGSLCSSGLIMPTTITAQDTARVTQSTKITVTGCPKAKRVKHTNAPHRKQPRRRAKK